MKLDYHLADGIGRIVLSNPPRNCLSRPAFESAERLAGFLAEPTLRGVLVSGAGRHFSAGADLAELEALKAEPDTFGRELEQGKALLQQLSFATVPVVAVIRGACLGAGLEIALACHFRVASEAALLGFPEATLGLMPGLGGTVAAPEVLPRAVAIDLVLSGRTIGGAEALELGVVDEVVATRGLDEAAGRFLDAMIARRSPELIRAILTSVHNTRRLGREEALREEGRLFLEVARAASHCGDDEGERK